MRKANAYCDVCECLVGDENEEENYLLYLFDKRKMDAAGSMENEYKSVDLCPEHLVAFIRYLASNDIRVTRMLDDYIKEFKIK